jgi:parallel beta-helix repeat protein
MKKRYLFLVLVLLFIGGCEEVKFSLDSEINEMPDELDYLINQKDSQGYLEGFLYIKFKKGYDVVSKEDALTLVNQLKGSNLKLSDVYEVKKAFKAAPGTKNYEAKKEVGLDRWVEISIPTDIDLEIESRLWKELPEVEIAEPVFILYPATVPDDPQFHYQWHLNNTGDNIPGVPSTPGADISALEAWEIAGQDGRKIANIEAVQWYHEDLVDNVWQNLGEDFDNDSTVFQWDDNLMRYVFDSGDENGIDDDGNGYVDDFIGWDFRDNDNDPSVTYSEAAPEHGTQTASAALAKSNNGAGVAGTCGDCSLVVTNNQLRGSYIFSAEQYEYAIDHSMVISMSLTTLSIPEIFWDIVQYGNMQGRVFVIAAGNYGKPDSNALCQFENVICVSGTSIYDEIMDFSSYGNTADIGAPCDHIRVAFPDNEYGWVWGTSFSAPIVAGVVAYMFDKNPLLSPKEALSIIQSSSDPFINPIVYAGNGRLNASRAIQMAEDSWEYRSFPVAMVDAGKTRVLDDTLEIYGSAAGSDFSSYQIWYGEGLYTSSWTLLVEETEPLYNGVLYSSVITDFPLEENLLENIQIKLITNDIYGQSAIDTFYSIPVYTIPTNGMVITEDVTFLPGEYELPDGIIIGEDDIVLDCLGSKIRGWNFQHDPSPMDGITINHKSGVMIRNCEVDGYSVGARLSNSNNILIEDCEFHFNGNGMKLMQSNNNVFIDNYIYYNRDFGINLDISNNNVIESNTISSNENIGLGLDYASNNNQINNNRFCYPNEVDLICVESENNFGEDNVFDVNLGCDGVIGLSCSCVDSDGGIDKYNFGEVIRGGFIYEDYCVSGTQNLTEYYCDGHSLGDVEIYCLYGCDQGACQLDCPEDWFECNGECVDPMTDENHCGGCNNPCPENQFCFDGECQSKPEEELPTMQEAEKPQKSSELSFWQRILNFFKK